MDDDTGKLLRVPQPLQVIVEMEAVNRQLESLTALEMATGYSVTAHRVEAVGNLFDSP